MLFALAPAVRGFAACKLDRQRGAGDIGYFVQGRQRSDRTATEVGRLFDLDQALARRSGPLGMDFFPQLGSAAQRWIRRRSIMVVLSGGSKHRIRSGVRQVGALE